jgi:excinuclease UvrABC ATPase subunit
MAAARADTASVGIGYTLYCGRTHRRPRVWKPATQCEGIGRTTQIDLDKLLDRDKSLNDGAILHPDFLVGKWGWKMYVRSGLFDNDKPLKKHSAQEMQQ